MLICIYIVLGLIILNLLLGAIASLILSGRMSREEEARELQMIKRQEYEREIKVGCILQSRGDGSDDKA